ncbi:4-hydroxy-3-methylbut-2-en-1-yl diphosphate synthase [Caminibacter mediatlanticus TB-2]|uniref:4-hydroxy-3-methylbut-2-en-1-yl diphosphate synthase n=1 Tax=Caminibacter mediatlanticus TB-2 TaxID=391592 RepID=A0ABX5VD09_9BACT|nr:4-hydroxy-3-methylbut-2-en-1-yl diphosphate synthase [Caminibacter mediatlanticus]QCT94974.1 4-hydroxy-3-methylbut-2-en-1-yl diphosphate synthase [Caminibacter mediatlanticus TB-2]
MSAATLIYIVGFSIVSLAFIFMFMILKPQKITKEKLVKVIGQEAIEKIKNAKDDNEIKEIIRSLPKKRKAKLKVLMESQDIRDVLKALHEHILKDSSESL